MPGYISLPVVTTTTLPRGLPSLRQLRPPPRSHAYADDDYGDYDELYSSRSSPLVLLAHDQRAIDAYAGDIVINFSPGISECMNTYEHDPREQMGDDTHGAIEYETDDEYIAYDDAYDDGHDDGHDDGYDDTLDDASDRASELSDDEHSDALEDDDDDDDD
jgi:hypothetical protein